MNKTGGLTEVFDGGAATRSNAIDEFPLNAGSTQSHPGAVSCKSSATLVQLFSA